MEQRHTSEQPDNDQLAAELTVAAYEVMLRHGLKDAFIDVELDLWQRVRTVLGLSGKEIQACPR